VRVRSAILGSLGSALEWFDFTLYAYVSPIIARLFFPASDGHTALLATFGIFATGFLMRPIGAIAFGSMGDRRGRRRALMLAVTMMSVPMLLIALLPTYGTIGVAAPILLLALRMVQGFSVGGEFSGTLVLMAESAPPGRRGAVAALAQTTSGCGVLLASLTTTILEATTTTGQMDDWGWRVPFVLGALIGLVALAMRLRMSETDSFTRARAAGELDRSPVRHAVTRERRGVLLVLGLAAYGGLAYFLVATYIPSYLQTEVHVVPEGALLGATLASVTFAVGCPLTGALSDRVGRRGVLAAAAAGLGLITLPAFLLMDAGTTGAAIAGQVGLMALVVGWSGPVSAVFSELLPTVTRYSGLSVGYNLAMAIFGGTAPLVATALISLTGDHTAPSWYLIAASVIVLALLRWTPETSRITLREHSPAASAGEAQAAAS
jgi:MFS transporter, MHS family, proline/betaine transporter